MKNMAIYNYQIEEKKRKRKDRIEFLLVGLPSLLLGTLFISSIEVIVESVLQLFGM